MVASYENLMKESKAIQEDLSKDLGSMKQKLKESEDFLKVVATSRDPL